MTKMEDIRRGQFGRCRTNDTAPADDNARGATLPSNAHSAEVDGQTPRKSSCGKFQHIGTRESIFTMWVQFSRYGVLFSSHGVRILTLWGPHSHLMRPPTIICGCTHKVRMVTRGNQRLMMTETA